MRSSYYIRKFYPCHYRITLTIAFHHISDCFCSAHMLHKLSHWWHTLDWHNVGGTGCTINPWFNCTENLSLTHLVLHPTMVHLITLCALDISSCVTVLLQVQTSRMACRSLALHFCPMCIASLSSVKWSCSSSVWLSGCGSDTGGSVVDVGGATKLIGASWGGVGPGIGDERAGKHHLALFMSNTESRFSLTSSSSAWSLPISSSSASPSW